MLRHQCLSFLGSLDRIDVFGQPEISPLNQWVVTMCQKCYQNGSGSEAQMAVDLMDLTWKLGMLVASEKCRLCRPRYHSQAEIGISSWETSRNPDGAETVITHEIWNPALLAQIISTWPIPACHGFFGQSKIGHRFKDFYFMKRMKKSWQLNWSPLMQYVGIGQRLELPGWAFPWPFLCLWKAPVVHSEMRETRRATFWWRVGAGSQNAWKSDQFAEKKWKEFVLLLMLSRFLVDLSFETSLIWTIDVAGGVLTSSVCGLRT